MNKKEILNTVNTLIKTSNDNTINFLLDIKEYILKGENHYENYAEEENVLCEIVDEIKSFTNKNPEDIFKLLINKKGFDSIETRILAEEGIGAILNQLEEEKRKNKMMELLIKLKSIDSIEKE